MASTASTMFTNSESTDNNVKLWRDVAASTAPVSGTFLEGGQGDVQLQVQRLNPDVSSAVIKSAQTYARSDVNAAVAYRQIGDPVFVNSSITSVGGRANNPGKVIVHTGGGDGKASKVELLSDNDIVAFAQLDAETDSVPASFGSQMSGIDIRPDGVVAAITVSRGVKASAKPRSTKNTATDDFMNSFELQENLGEGMAKSSATELAIMSSSGLARVIVSNKSSSEGDVTLDGNWCQPQWISNGALVAVHCACSTRNLGSKFFNTRSTAIYHLILPSQPATTSPDTSIMTSMTMQATLLTPDDHSATSPRVSPDLSRIMYTTTDRVPFHTACCRLRLMQLNKESCSSAETLVEVVSEVKDVDSFPGLWLPPALPANVWLNDSRHVCLATQWGSRKAIVIVDTDNNSNDGSNVRRLPLPSGVHALSSVDLYDVNNTDGTIMVAVSDLTTRPSVYIVAVNTVNLEECVWTRIVTGTRACDAEIEVITTAVGNGSKSGGGIGGSTDSSFESILITPAASVCESPRLVVFPHGGPHSGFTTTFSRDVAHMVAMGLAVLMVNYRGSTGFGQAALESIVVGKTDVGDCIVAMHTAVNLSTRLSSGNVAVCGGSHGGYLTAMLIGLHPNVFKAAVCRNPVTNIAHMLNTTDIPDWCHTAAGLPYTEENTADAEELASMFRISPIAYVGAVVTPLLILLGDADLRVPMSQSIDYYRLLKAQKKASVKCVSYPNGQHGLDDSADMLMHKAIIAVEWLLR